MNAMWKKAMVGVVLAVASAGVCHMPSLHAGTTGFSKPEHVVAKLKWPWKWKMWKKSKPQKEATGREWQVGGIYDTAEAASAHVLELQRLGFEAKPVPNIYGGWTVLYRQPLCKGEKK
jgi:hypothetical protein